MANKTPEYHVGCGFAGIYAGTLMPKREGKPQMWRSKSDVTDEALVAVRDYLYDQFIKNGKTQGGYEWTRKDGKIVSLLVVVEDKHDAD